MPDPQGEGEHKCHIKILKTNDFGSENIAINGTLGAESSVYTCRMTLPFQTECPT
jgi:hypothetical protein